MQAVARQTSRGGDPATFLDRLSPRITGLAASQDLMIQNSWRGVDLNKLVSTQVSHFCDVGGIRMKIEGPPLTVSASAAQALSMAMFELGTNAAKYGAFSNDSGSVHVS